jgi:transcription termination/antitermination protein NusA
MVEITLDNATLALIRLFEEATDARVRDCLTAEDKVVFLVEPDDLPKAVGPSGVRIERLKSLLKKELMVVAFSEDPQTLAMNIFFAYHPLSADFGVKGTGRHVTVHVDPVWKARAIGKQGKNLKIARAILLRHSDIVSVSVA